MSTYPLIDGTTLYSCSVDGHQRLKTDPTAIVGANFGFVCWSSDKPGYRAYRNSDTMPRCLGTFPTFAIADTAVRSDAVAMHPDLVIA